MFKQKDITHTLILTYSLFSNWQVSQTEVDITYLDENVHSEIGLHLPEYIFNSFQMLLHFEYLNSTL